MPVTTTNYIGFNLVTRTILTEVVELMKSRLDLINLLKDDL